MCPIILIVILLMATRVDSWPAQSYQQQHRVFMSQMSRENSKPVKTGFAYSQMNNNPAKFETFGNSSGGLVQYSDANIANHEANIEPKDSGLSDSPVDMYGGMSMLDSHLPLRNLKTSFDNSAFSTATESTMPYTTKSWTEQAIKYEIAKTKSKYNSDPLLSVSAKRNPIEDIMQSVMNLKLPSDPLEDSIPKYDFSREFHIDDDDVKTLTSNTYEWWPYFSHSPYEYEHIKIDSDIQKAKEKRYADERYADIDLPVRVIPVHESNDDYSNSYDSVNPTYNRMSTNDNDDNPIEGDGAFFSFVLNDYFDKNKDDDHLSFKGLEWGTDFDTDNQRQLKEYGKRDSRSNDHNDYLDNSIDYGHFDTAHKGIGESATERGYDRTYNVDTRENGKSQKENHKSDRAHSGHNQAHSKDFVDQFANEFGNASHKKHSNYALKSNKENGEKRKGFRRVYHKDEYQEDNEFFDNSGNSAKSDDSGSSTVHNGGSVAGLQSHAAAVSRNEANAFDNVGNTELNKLATKYNGNDAKHGFDRDFNRYIDIAKQTAHRNKAANFY